MKDNLKHTKNSSGYVIVAKEEPAYLIVFSRFGTYGLDLG
jgi:hypothetical protein